MVFPIRITAPSEIAAFSTRLPLTRTPLVEPRSCTLTRGPQASSVTRISMCLRETPGSLTRRSASLPRPTTIPGAASGSRSPLTSRKAVARRTWVSLASGPAWLILAIAWLRTRNRPVVRSSATSRVTPTGPVKT